jgi:hypothetical protein
MEKRQHHTALMKLSLVQEINSLESKREETIIPVQSIIKPNTASVTRNHSVYRRKSMENTYVDTIDPVLLKPVLRERESLIKIVDVP